MRTTGRCMVAIENKKGDWWQIALDANGMAFVLQALEQYQGGTLKIIRNKLPFTMGKLDD